jgi:hypothetical protein
MTRARDVSNTINTSNFAAKNWFLNGACEFWQRGSSYSGAQTNLYLMDRWFGINVSAMSRSTDVPTDTNFQYSLSFGHSTASYPLLAYRMPSEESRFLAGKKVTLSFWAKNVSGTAVLYGEYQTPNTNNDFSAVTNQGGVGVFSYSPSSSWVRYSSTFTLTSDTLRGLEFRIVRDAASAATTLVTGMQLEIGGAVTGFSRRSGDYATELAACQRYYFRDSLNKHLCYVRDTGAIFFSKDFPISMRTVPTSFTHNLTTKVPAGSFPGTAGQIGFYGNGWIAASATALSCSSDGSTTTTGAAYILGFTVTLGQIMSLQNNDLSWFAWDAEL